ncbi:hypothetical protein AXG93_3218s1040 [Marchantia polymorpha subsp. ruderalis]|nr:hypothetical protein AXG93_3218s1040 [Marchantia polymorpha subsp. ruderalis]
MRISLLAVCGLLVVLSSSAGVAAQTINSTYYTEGCYWGTCPARISYFAKPGETLQTIADLFGVDFDELMGANNLDITKAAELKTTKLANGTLLLVPQLCECLSSGSTFTGASVRRTNRTVYTVKSGDTLSKIADDYFGGLTTYPEIAAVNQIENVNEIFPDQKLVIPFMCSCPNVTEPEPYRIGLSYLVQPGDDFSEIATKFGSSASFLQTFNNITNSSALLASSLIRVPLAACKANFSGGAQDGNLVVTNGAYNLTTSEDCVQCKCYIEGNATVPSMNCVPNPARDTAKCPSLDCSAGLSIGNFTTKAVATGCEVTTCEYKGFINAGKVEKPYTQSVEPTCPAYSSAPAPSQLGSVPGSSSSPSTPGAAPGTPGAPSNSSSVALSPRHPLLLSAATVVVSVLLFTR